MRAVFYKKLYVFRVVSLNLERLRHERSRLFDREERSVSVSTSVTFGAEFRGKQKVHQNASESKKKDQHIKLPQPLAAEPLAVRYW